MKIVFSDGKSAAIHINEIYNKPNDWWFSDKVQEARAKFVDKYAYTSGNWINIWIKELSEAAQKNT